MDKDEQNYFLGIREGVTYTVTDLRKFRSCSFKFRQLLFSTKIKWTIWVNDQSMKLRKLGSKIDFSSIFVQPDNKDGLKQIDKLMWIGLD